MHPLTRPLKNWWHSEQGQRKQMILTALSLARMQKNSDRIKELLIELRELK